MKNDDQAFESDQTFEFLKNLTCAQPNVRFFKTVLYRNRVIKVAILEPRCIETALFKYRVVRGTTVINFAEWTEFSRFLVLELFYLSLSLSLSRTIIPE